ncbi:unnamed protein product, partial [Didymodactylos carnosus]
SGRRKPFSDDEQAAAGDSVTQYTRFEYILNLNLKDSDVAKEFVELGYRGIGHAVSRKDFEERKRRAGIVLSTRREGPPPITSDSLTVIEPFAKALAFREEANRTTKLLTIIFIRDKNSVGREISAYIDFAHRLKLEDFTGFFTGDKKLVPLSSDLSYYNWDTHACTTNDTNNFSLLANAVSGIRFRCTHDRKVIFVDPESKQYGDGTTRT